MDHYSIYPRDQTLVKSYVFSSVPIKIGERISKTLSKKYSHKLFDHAKIP